MTSKALAKSLLRIVQSSDEREIFTSSATLHDFVRDSGIGMIRKSQLIFTSAHKQRICAWLRADNIDPTTPPDAWSSIGRSQALSLGPDEKWATDPVRTGRIAFKSLNGQPLIIDGRQVFLPPQANLEWAVAIALTGLSHESVIVVENWETFDRINDLELDMRRTGGNPLVIWRGGGQRSSTGAAMTFIEAYGRPVWSAPDYDPEGLAIAARMPHLAGVLAPPLNRLKELLKESRLSDRFQCQLPGATTTLENASHPDIRALWLLVRNEGRALPQERLCNSTSKE